LALEQLVHRRMPALPTVTLVRICSSVAVALDIALAETTLTQSTGRFMREADFN
jgi:hypothetical protein